jgi:hypothetical protein
MAAFYPGGHTMDIEMAVMDLASDPNRHLV